MVAGGPSSADASRVDIHRMSILESLTKEPTMPQKVYKVIVNFRPDTSRANRDIVWRALATHAADCSRIHKRTSFRMDETVQLESVNPATKEIIQPHRKQFTVTWFGKEAGRAHAALLDHIYSIPSLHEDLEAMMAQGAD
jgi:hypothetical protein